MPERLFQPIKFETAAQVTSYVEEEARKGLPAGWRLHPAQGSLSWLIVEEGKNPSMESYLLEVSNDFTHFIVFCDNTDAGPWGVHMLALNAKVIPLEGLQFHPLSKALAYIVTHARPNTWGLT